jgi:hypothetical protein
MKNYIFDDIFLDISLLPSPGEGPRTATKTSAPPRGRANRAAPGLALHLGLGFVPAPPEVHGNLQIARDTSIFLQCHVFSLVLLSENAL